MKQQSSHIFLVLLFFFFLLSSFSAISARLFVPKQGKKEVQANDTAQAHAWSFTELKDDREILGSEECDEKDEECFSRRMISEAHLDYIYTQHHNP